MHSLPAVVLEYHDVVDGDFDASGFPGPAAATYKLTRRDFAAHLTLLAQTPGGIAAVESLHRGEMPVHGVVLTFDDGGVSAYECTAPMLEAAGCRGVFFITTDRVGSPGFLSRAQILELHARGHVIGSHSCSHPTRMAACSVHELQREWGDSLHYLSDMLRTPVTTASVPGGYWSRAVGETAAAAGARVIFSSEPTLQMERHDGYVVVGRFTLRRGDAPERAAALAGESNRARRRQWMEWNAKKILKAIGGESYLRMRARLMREERPPARPPAGRD